MNRFLLYSALLVCASTASAQEAVDATAEIGQPFIRNYGPAEYNGSVQTWSIAQDHRGILYAGQNAGVLTYDGVAWRTIRMPTAARAVGVSESGTVYVGSGDDLGFLAPDSVGQLGFQSLRDRLSEEDKQNIGDVHYIAVDGETIWLSSRKRLFRWQPAGSGTLTTWEPEDSFQGLWAAHGDIYVRDGGKPLKVAGDALQPLPGIGEKLEDFRAVVPYGSGHVLFYTNASGAFTYDGQALRPVHGDLNSYLVDVWTATILGDSTFAVVASNKLIHHDARGRILTISDKATGLPSNELNRISSGRYGGVWIGSGNGISHIELTSPLTRYGEERGLIGSVEAMVRHEGYLYAATATGVYRLQSAQGDAPRAVFEPVEGIASQSWSLLQFGSQLLASNLYGVYRIDGLRSSRILEAYTFGIHRHPSDSSRVLVIGAISGLGTMRYDAERQVWGPLETLGGVEEALHNDVVYLPDGAVLVMDRSGRLLRIPIDDHPADDVQAEYLEHGDMLFQVGSRAYASSEDGGFRYDPSAKRLEPDPTFADALDDNRRLIFAQSIGEEVWGVSMAPSGMATLAAERAEPRLDGSYRRTTPMALGRLSLPAINSFLKEAEGTDHPILWMGANLGLFRLEMGRGDAPAPARPLVRRVTTGGDSLLYGGHPTPAYQAPRLQHSREALRFTYALPAFDAPDRNRYQVRLDGYDDDWSDWSDETQKDYTNLREGRYAFLVRAKDVYGQTSEAQPFAFRVLPPWYRTWWAYLLYALLGAGLLYAAARAWGWRLEQQNRRLEATIAERTLEVRQKNEENERLLLNILPGPIAERLKLTDEPIADAFADVTVLFSDLVGFTTLALSVDADRLVALLNDLFSRYDALAQELGVEKIKTIGDAYMAVCGLPVERPDHAAVAARMALGMFEATDQFNREQGTDLQVRIGLNSGPVVAGVIGTHKFIYDLWGDTVNTAARMESHGVPGRVHVSESTWAQIAGSFEAEARGAIQVKGKGQMETYLLNGRKMSHALPAAVIES